jgi:hypothetical protein
MSPQLGRRRCIEELRPKFAECVPTEFRQVRKTLVNRVRHNTSNRLSNIDASFRRKFKPNVALKCRGNGPFTAFLAEKMNRRSVSSFFGASRGLAPAIRTTTINVLGWQGLTSQPCSENLLSELDFPERRTPPEARNPKPVICE